PRLRGLAAAAADPAQARHRSSRHADRLDPAQRLLRRARGARGREPGAAPGGDAGPGALNSPPSPAGMDYYPGTKVPHAGRAFQPDGPGASGWKARPTFLPG